MLKRVIRAASVPVPGQFRSFGPAELPATLDSVPDSYAIYHESVWDVSVKRGVSGQRPALEPGED